MDEIQKIYDKLESVERNFGFGGLIIIVIIALLLWGLFLFIKSYVNSWGQDTFSNELAKYKKELNLELGNVLVDKLSNVNKDIEFLKSKLSSKNKKRLNYHSEKANCYKTIYDLINTWFYELTDFHQGGVDMWDSEKLRERVAYLSKMSNTLKIQIAKLRMFTNDDDLIDKVNSINLLILDNLYTPPKQYLLEIRAWLVDYNSNINNTDRIEELLKINKDISKKFRENLLENIKIVTPYLIEFHNYYRNKYYELSNEEENAIANKP